MINDDLIKYIEAQKERGVNREDVSLKLSSAGWNAEDINEGLDKFFVSTVTPISTPPEVLNPILMPKVLGPAGAVPIEKPEPTVGININQKANIDPRVNSFDSFRPEQKPEPAITANVMSPGPLPQGAVTASFRKDYQNLETIYDEPKRHWGRLVAIIIIVVILLGGGVIFANVKGYISLPFEIPFFKPSPELVMAKMMGNLGKIQTAHYSTDIDATVEITEEKSPLQPSADHVLPPVGQTDLYQEPKLDTGPSKPVASKIKIHSETDSDTTNALSPKSSSVFSVNMSLFGGLNINLDSEYRIVDQISYIKIPDFAMLRDFAGGVNSWISFKKNDLNELSSATTDLPISVPKLYDEAKIKQIKDLIQKTTFTDKVVEIGIEKLGDESTHHYQVSLNKEATKNFAAKLLDIIDDTDLNASRTDILSKLDYLNEMKIDMWLAKATFDPRKFVFTFSTLESNIADSTKAKVDIVVTSVISKINEPVSIVAPEGARSIIEDLKNAKMKSEDAQIKSTLSGFTVEAKKFFAKHKNSYGIQSPSGDCIAPIKDSLFYNSEMINYLNQTIKNKASCYSTPKEWAVAVALSTDQTVMWCVDSTGHNKETSIPLTGPVCK